MATIDELRKARLAKLEAIKKAGLWAYPVTNKRTHAISEVYSAWSKLEEGAKEVVIVGRVMSMRSHGGMTFADIQDGTGKMQILLKRMVWAKRLINSLAIILMSAILLR